MTGSVRPPPRYGTASPPPCPRGPIMRTVSTDHVTAWAWLIVTAWVTLGWIPVDLWLHAHGHPYLTTQMRAWMRSPRYGWAIWAFLIALPVAFMAHMLIVGRAQ